MPRALTVQEIEDFRSDLIEVAKDLFAERGFDGVTLRAIASELGCSPMTPYRYFENKDAIFVAVQTEGFRIFGARVAAAAQSEADPLERLRALSRAYLAFALEEPALYRVMFQLERPDMDLLAEEQHRQSVESTWHPLLETLTELVASGVFEGDPLTLAHLCWVDLHGLVTLHLAGRLKFERSLQDLVDPLFEARVRASLARPQGVPR